MSLVLIPDGPGTTIEVRDGFQGLPPAPRGTGAIVGQYPSGPVSHAALAISPEAARLISGEANDDFEASLSLDDLYSEDTPPTLIGRVTDGNELKSAVDIWDRNADRSYSKSNGDLVADRAPLAIGLADNGGRWAGRKRAMVGKVAAIATDLTSTTLDLATSPEFPTSLDGGTTATFFEDVLAGAQLFIEGDGSSPYEIVSNDTAGVVTIKGDFSQDAQDADGTGSITGDWRVVLDHDRELSIIIGQDSITESEFSLTGLRKFQGGADWESVTAYDNLGLSSSDDKPWVQTITDGELTRYQIAISTSFDPAGTVEEKLPANFCEIPTDVTAATLTYQWYRWSPAGANTGDGYIADPVAIDTSDIEPHVYTITLTSAAAFDVSVQFPGGTVQDLPAGVVGTPYVPDHGQLAGFTVVAGAVAFVAADVITVRINPLPVDLAQREAFVYPVALSPDGNPTQRLRIVSNTYNTLSIRSDLLLSDFSSAASLSPEIITADLSAISLAGAETVIITPDGLAAVTLTSAGSGPGVAAISAELTALDTDDIFIFDVDPSDATKMRIRLSESVGSKASMELGAGTGHAGLGIATTGTTVGTDGVPFRIEARMPMWGGYDGVTPADAQYLIALDLSDHIFKRWLTTNLGLVRLATPGITSTGVKDAVSALVAQNGWKGLAEFDSSIEDTSLPAENAIADMLANESESDYVDHIFPSRAKFLNVAKTKLVTRSVSGLFMGIKSRLANVGADGEKGFHIAAANNNIQGKLSPRVKGLSDGIDRWTPPKKLLSDHGIVTILWEGPDVYLWGNRMFSKGRTEAGKRYTITERDVFYHVARDLFVTTRPNIFKSISARRLGEIQTQLRSKMKPYHQDGWFSDFGGTKPGFEQQVTVLVPLSLNPPSALLEGNVTASIEFRPRPALENLKIIISPTQLSSEAT